MKLYEINREIDNILSKVDENGELSTEYIDNLNKLEIEKNKKIESIGLYIKNLNAESIAIKAEIDQFQKRKKSIDNTVESLKKYLQYQLQNEKFKTPKISISYRKSQAVEILDATMLPRSVLLTKIEPSKTLIKDFIKENGECSGATIAEKQSIIIK